MCWTCGPLPLAKTLAEISGKPWHVVSGLLGQLEKSWEPRERTTGRLEIPKGVGPLLGCHKEYLAGRNLDPNLLEKLWCLQGIGMARHLAWTVFIPIQLRGKTVSWTTRSIAKEGPRYWSAKPEQEAIFHKTLLLGEDFARHSVCVVEGPMDAMNVGPGAVATFGVGSTPAQVLRISRYPVRAVVFDSEPKAQERARKLCSDLAAFPGRTVRVELDAQDPGSASKREITKLRKEFIE